MGHSTISKTEKGMLTSSEMEKLLKDQKSFGEYEDQRDWSQVWSIDTKNTSEVFSASEAREKLNTLHSGKSAGFYYVSDDVWNKHFNKDNKAIDSLVKKLDKKKIDLNNFTSKTSPKVTAKPLFFSCLKCESKINMSAIKSTPRCCPVCYQGGTDFSTSWETKKFGKGFVTKQDKMEKEIKVLAAQIQALKEKRPKVINVWDMPPSFKKEVKTVIASDIHH